MKRLPLEQRIANCTKKIESLMQENEACRKELRGLPFGAARIATLQYTINQNEVLIEMCNEQLVKMTSEEKEGN